MAKINREYVLKTFLDKVREAKRQGMTEIKVPVRFLDDLAYIVYQLMTEELSKAYNSIEVKPKDEVKPQLPINRKVLKEITPKKLDSILPKEETIKVIVPNGLNEKSEPTTYTAEVPLPKIEEVIKEVEEPKKEEIPENNIEDEEEDDDNTNIMYGGTW